VATSRCRNRSTVGRGSVWGVGGGRGRGECGVHSEASPGQLVSRGKGWGVGGGDIHDRHSGQQLLARQSDATGAHGIQQYHPTPHPSPSLCRCTQCDAPACIARRNSATGSTLRPMPHSSHQRQHAQARHHLTCNRSDSLPPLPPPAPPIPRQAVRLTRVCIVGAVAHVRNRDGGGIGRCQARKRPQVHPAAAASRRCSVAAIQLQGGGWDGGGGVRLCAGILPVSCDSPSPPQTTARELATDGGGRSAARSAP
jgi:hypothetical protein